MTQTRAQHLQWVRQRAIDEFRFSGKPADAVASIISDLGKHPETAGSGQVIGALALMQLASGQLNTEAQIKKFVDGIN